MGGEQGGAGPFPGGELLEGHVGFACIRFR